MAKANPKGQPPQRIRIIAGIWRGRHLQVPPCPSVRPTPARVRETVFNWLAGSIENAECIDLYAGSGALGFEAASRGARQVTLVDRDRGIARRLRQEAAKLSATQIEVICAQALAYIDRLRDPVDILFLDPPFAPDSDLLEKTCAHLAASRALKESSLVYVESPASWDARAPTRWTLLKSKQTGRVGYHLFAARPRSSLPANSPSGIVLQ